MAWSIQENMVRGLCGEIHAARERLHVAFVVAMVHGSDLRRLEHLDVDRNVGLKKEIVGATAVRAHGQGRGVEARGEGGGSHGLELGSGVGTPVECQGERMTGEGRQYEKEWQLMGEVSS